MKRLFDLVVSTSILVVLSFSLGLIILVLRISHGKSGVFFKQNRIGINQKPFHVLKFKSMSDERDETGNLLPDQERMTAVGTFLRKTSLDELPQLLNVLKGDMSLVGPRPLLPKYLPLYSPEQNRRHEVKPGITGWAQINGRNNISWTKKFELDVWYVDNQSIWLDIEIIWKTLLKVVKRKDITTEDPRAFKPFNGSN
jgi:lipopolysaccharide/colanic/teichoic acid biosynthesis glycosyltransferase